MIEFFRDVLDGPLYIVVTILSTIFIMAIIGFLMERKKLEKEAKAKVAVVGAPISDIPKEVTPITPVTIEKSENVAVPATVSTPISNLNQGVQISATGPTPVSNLNQEIQIPIEVEKPVIVFEEPTQKTE